MRSLLFAILLLALCGCSSTTTRAPASNADADVCSEQENSYRMPCYYQFYDRMDRWERLDY